MDILQNIKTCYNTGMDIYNLINSTKQLKFRYADICNDILIILELLDELKKSQRLCQSEFIVDTIYSLEENLKKLEMRINKSKNLNLRRRFLNVIFNDIQDKKDQLNVILNRLKLLMEINREKKLESRFDIINLFENENSNNFVEDCGGEKTDIKELINFWDRNFGSESNRLQLDIFIQCLENECHHKLRRQEMQILEKLLDTDCNKYISTYEAYFFLRKFGPLSNCIKNSLNCVYDKKHDKFHDWYLGDVFPEKVVNYLYDKGFGTTIIRNKFFGGRKENHGWSNIVFYIDFVGWSFSKSETTILQIPIIKFNNMYELDIKKIEHCLKILSNEGHEFMRTFKVLFEQIVSKMDDTQKFCTCGVIHEHKGFSESKGVLFDNLHELYIFFLCCLKEYAKLTGLIYFPYLEKNNMNLVELIQGEIVNFFNKFNGKWSYLRNRNNLRFTEQWMSSKKKSKKNPDLFNFMDCTNPDID